MVDSPTSSSTDFAAAFVANERQERLHTGKIACMLVIVLMPAGIALDYFVYPKNLGGFLVLRLMCSLLAAGLWFLHTTQFGYRHYRLLGIPIAWLPTFFMAWMIYSTEGPNSPYYAGLNLVVLAVSAVVRWNTKESLIAVGGVLLMYLAACLLKGSREQIPIIFNNGYFLILTGVIVVVGNHFFYRLRLSEFSLRYELDKNRAALEESNRKLVELDQIKSRFFANISHELRTPLTLLLAPLETLLQRFHRARRRNAQSAGHHARQRHAPAQAHQRFARPGPPRIRPHGDQTRTARRGRNLSRASPAPPARWPTTNASGWKPRSPPDWARSWPTATNWKKSCSTCCSTPSSSPPPAGASSCAPNKQGEELVLIVSDTGMGIAEKNLPFIFDRFWQADGSSKRKYQGVGIGLALVKELVEIQGGKVTVRKPGRQGHHVHRAPALSKRTNPERKPALPEARAAAGLTPATGAHGVFRGMAGQSVPPRRIVPGTDALAAVAASRWNLPRNGSAPRCWWPTTSRTCCAS